MSQREGGEPATSPGLLTRAQSLRQQFADSRNASSACTTTLHSTVRWPQRQETALSPAAEPSATAASSKSPSPSRKTGIKRIPSSSMIKTWTNSGTPPSSRRPATPTASCDQFNDPPSSAAHSDAAKESDDPLVVNHYLKVVAASVFLCGIDTCASAADELDGRGGGHEFLTTRLNPK